MQFDTRLRQKWDQAMKEGHFRYQLDKVETKIIPGQKKYVAQVSVWKLAIRQTKSKTKLLKHPFVNVDSNFIKTI